MMMMRGRRRKDKGTHNDKKMIVFIDADIKRLLLFFLVMLIILK